MLDPYELTVHTLTLRQLGSAEDLSDINGLAVDDVEAALEKAVVEGTVMAARGNNMITPRAVNSSTPCTRARSLRCGPTRLSQQRWMPSKRA